MAQLDVSEAHHGTSATIGVGDVIALTLPENASTGYRWTLGELDATRLVVEDSGHRPRGASVGGGGDAFWMLRAQASGKARIDAKRWRPWEGERSIIERFTLDVEINPSP